MHISLSKLLSSKETAEQMKINNLVSFLFFFIVILFILYWISLNTYFTYVYIHIHLKFYIRRSLPSFIYTFCIIFSFFSFINKWKIIMIKKLVFVKASLPPLWTNRSCKFSFKLINSESTYIDYDDKDG